MPRCTFSVEDIQKDNDVPDSTLPEEWRCPRRASDDCEHCLLHRSPSQKDTESATNAVLQSLEATREESPFVVDLNTQDFDEERKRLIGIKLGSLNLSSKVIKRTDTSPIDFRFAKIDHLNLSDTWIKSDLDLRGAEVRKFDACELDVDGDISGDYLKIRHGVLADSANISGTLALNDTESNFISLNSTHIGGRLELNDAEIESEFCGTELIVDGRFEFKRGDIGGRIHCPGLQLRGEKRYSNTSELTLRNTIVASHVNLEYVRSSGSLLLNDLQVGGDFRMNGLELEANLWLGAVDDESTTLGSVQVDGNLLVKNGFIGGDADLAESTMQTECGPIVDGSIDLSGTVIEGEITCSPNLTDNAFNVVRLRDTVLKSGTLEDPKNGDRVLYDLRNATIGDIELKGVNGSVDGHHLVETQFDEFVFGIYREVFDADNWKIHEIFDGGYQDLAVATVAPNAAELADDLLVAVADIDGFCDAVGSEEYQGQILELIAAKYDTEAIADGTEKVREKALPSAFDSRENNRKGLIRGLSESYQKNVDTKATIILNNLKVRELLLKAAQDEYISDRRTGPAIDPGRAKIRNDLHTAVALCIADRDIEVPETNTLLTTYLLAKNGANRVGDTNAASQFFRIEMRYRRRNHWESLRGHKTVSGIARSAYDVSSNLLFDISSGYGEQPRRVLVFSMSVVIIFTGLFVVMLDTPPYNGALGYFLLSLESFVSLILSGGTEQTDPLVRLTATVEGFIGAFLIALFVFTLTRSIDR